MCRFHKVYSRFWPLFDIIQLLQNWFCGVLRKWIDMATLGLHVLCGYFVHVSALLLCKWRPTDWYCILQETHIHINTAYQLDQIHLFGEDQCIPNCKSEINGIYQLLWWLDYWYIVNLSLHDKLNLKWVDPNPTRNIITLFILLVRQVMQ